MLVAFGDERHLTDRTRVEYQCGQAIYGVEEHWKIEKSRIGGVVSRAKQKRLDEYFIEGGR